MVIEKEKILGIAQKYILKGQSKKAIKEYLRLIEITPKDKRLYLKLGDLYLKIGENEKAVQEYLKLASLYEEEDLNFRAISIYKRILSIKPKLLDAFKKIAKLYLREGLVGSAKNYYQSVLEIKPDEEEALKALESVESRQQPKEVSKLSPFAEPIIPKHPHPQEKGTIEEKAYPPPASSEYSQMSSNETQIPSSDKDSEMHYHLGIAYKEMELFDYAISEFELASSNPSIEFDCYIMLGNCFMEQGDYNKSIQYYKMASEIKGLPEDKLARLHFSLGLAYEANGMVSEAIDTFNLVLKLDRSFPEVEGRINKLLQK